MPRPCQKRRASAAAQRKSKPAAPPPIRHKARQKAIHNARRGRGRTQNVGGRPSRDQPGGNETEQDFISFANKGNHFHMLNGTGSRHDPFSLDSNPDMDLEDAERLLESDSEEDDSEDSDMQDAGDMMINVAHTTIARGRGPRAEIMYTIPAAVLIYKDLLRTRFPLQATSAIRYSIDMAIHTDTEPDLSLVPSPASEQQGMSSATSVASHASPASNMSGRDYVFNWGKYDGQRFSDVPENYLRTIGGQLDVYEGRHPGLRAAYEYYRPGQARNAPPAAPTAPKQQTRSQTKQAQPPKKQQQQPAPRPSFPRSNMQGLSDTYKFTKGPHKGKKLAEVPENYLRTLEGMPKVIEKWPRLIPALQDFNRRTGRTGRV
ncbi:hypothetical protein ACN47E_001984 [Coniothyrium glycines]